ncbi:hypothetical protein Pfo_031337 [Paulownia fortunei]|nr:hypothetical protein Pfo_031337 [Paulownia fortunei]
MKPVRKAIIPAAGLGTRFLPATKALAKEMLPIVDTPTIEYIVREAIESGIEDIVIVDGKSKRSIEDHFDSNPELENNLREKGKDALLKVVEETTDINMYFIRQSHPKGLGDAVLTAKAFIGDEPFVVLLGDDLMQDEVPLTKQLIDRYEETGESTLAVMKVPHDQVSEYGVIDPAAQVNDDGPAGMTAATYASRANLSVLMLDRGIYGGQMNIRQKLKIILVERVELKDDLKYIHTDMDDYVAKAVIIATGSEHIHLGAMARKNIKVVAWCFIYVGLKANTQGFENLDITDSEGWILTDDKMQTTIPGIFAVGDVRVKDLRQITTAVGDGGLAGQGVYDYISHLQTAVQTTTTD